MRWYRAEENRREAVTMEKRWRGPYAVAALRRTAGGQDFHPAGFRGEELRECSLYQFGDEPLRSFCLREWYRSGTDHYAAGGDRGRGDPSGEDAFVSGWDPILWEGIDKSEIFLWAGAGVSYRICRESSRRGSQQAAVFFSGGESEEPVPVPAGFWRVPVGGGRRDAGGGDPGLLWGAQADDRGPASKGAGAVSLLSDRRRYACRCQRIRQPGEAGTGAEYAAWDSGKLCGGYGEVRFCGGGGQDPGGFQFHSRTAGEG